MNSAYLIGQVDRKDGICRTKQIRIAKFKVSKFINQLGEFTILGICGDSSWVQETFKTKDKTLDRVILLNNASRDINAQINYCGYDPRGKYLGK